MSALLRRLPSAGLISALTLLLYHKLIPIMNQDPNNPLGTCNAIASIISSRSNVYYSGSIMHEEDLDHWESSSTQESRCTVEPGTEEDVGKILRIVGRARTPFGVKSGGHASNPNFSSSEGVSISLHRFNELKYDPVSKTATIGTGLAFDDVYAELEPYGVSVLGGRVTGVGVGDFVLGGGYSWKMNQYGLAADTITAYELVKPNGNVVTVTETSDPDLFFGLKDGFNNFGIVTRVVMRTYPQMSVWGGLITYPRSSIPEVSAAVTKFSGSNTDPKANIISRYNCMLTKPVVTQFLFYDGPNPPPGLFDDFLDIPALTKDVGTRTLYDYLQLNSSNIASDIRLGGVSHTIPILRYSAGVLATIHDEFNSFCDALTLGSLSAPFVSYDIEPFTPSVRHNMKPTTVYMPLNIHFAWVIDGFDNKILDAINGSAARILNAALAEGQGITNAPLYPNDTIFDSPLNRMYGSGENRLMALKRRIDPFNVMELAGGFRL